MKTPLNCPELGSHYLQGVRLLYHRRKEALTWWSWKRPSPARAEKGWGREGGWRKGDRCKKQSGKSRLLTVLWIWAVAESSLIGRSSWTEAAGTERKDGRKRGCLGTETGFYVRCTELQCSGGPSGHWSFRWLGLRDINVDHPSIEVIAGVSSPHRLG